MHKALGEADKSCIPRGRWFSPIHMMTPEQLVRSILQLDPASELYQTLGISSTADQAAVQQSYLRRARDTHPDKNPAPGAEDAFKRVAHARSVLCDAALRSAYDSALQSARPKHVSRPCERRAAQRRAAHAAGSSSEQADSGSARGDVWCSWQPRTPTTPTTADHHARPRLSKAAKARRRASGRADSAAAAAAAAAMGTVGKKGAMGGGQGRGDLGKRPWRRAARAQAKKEATLEKARTKARKHLQADSKKR